MMEDLFKDNTYAKEKMEKAIKVLKKAYYESSVLEKIVDVRNSGPDEHGFLDLYFNPLIPEEWFTRQDHYIDLVFMQFGEGLARSEKKYILDQIFAEKNVPKVDFKENVQEVFVSNFKKFLENKRVHTVFIPVDFYVDMYTKWSKKSSDFEIDFATGEISVCGVKPNIIWSSKLTSFADFVLMDKSFGVWASKPSFAERLTTRISKSEKEGMLALLFFTKMKFKILNADKILILHRNTESAK